MDKVWMTLAICVTIALLGISYMVYDIRRCRIEFDSRKIRWQMLHEDAEQQNSQMIRLLSPDPEKTSQPRMERRPTVPQPEPEPEPSAQPEKRKGSVKGYYYGKGGNVELMERSGNE